MTVMRAPLNAREAKREIKALRQAGKAIRKSPASARAFLFKHGFITKEGKLAKRYRG